MTPRSARGAEERVELGHATDPYVGQWTGIAQCGGERREIGFAFEKQIDGTVTARLWLPEIFAYGSNVGTLKAEGNSASIPEWGIQFSLQDAQLTGSLMQPELSFAVHRTSNLPAEPLLPEISVGPGPLWRIKTGPLVASPTIVAGALIVADTAGVIRAVEPRDGSIRWLRNLGSPVYGRVAQSTGRLYVAADSGELHCLDASTGDEHWCRSFGPRETKHCIPTHFGDMEWDFSGPDPVVSEGVVYLAGADHCMRAIDEGSGKLKWEFPAGERIRGGTCLAGERLVFGSRDGYVYSINRRDGKLCWKFDTGSPVNTAPLCAGDRIVIGTRDKSRLFALDAATGQPVWSVYYWLSWVESTPVLVDGILYVGASDAQRIRAIDARSGRVIWDTQVWGWTWGTPLVVGETVYYGSAGAREYFVHQRPSIGAIDRKTGALRWRRELETSPSQYMSGVATSLAICGDRIIAAGVDGWLSAFPAK